MKELEYKKNLQRLKEYKYYKTKLKDPNTKKQMVTPKYPEQNRDLEHFGRYPPGFQHFENPEKYAQMFPDRTLGHYHAHMNRDCTFYEYVEMMVSARLRDIRYEINKRIHYDKEEKEDVYNPLKPEQKTRIINEIFDDPETREEIMGQFNFIVRNANQVGSTFKFIDSLEMFANIYNLPLYGGL